MCGQGIVSLHNPWFTASVGITAAIAIVAVIAGFAWLPLQQQGERFRGVGPQPSSQTLDGPRPERVALLSGDYRLRTLSLLTLLRILAPNQGYQTLDLHH